MKTVVGIKQIPGHSIVLKDFGKVDYYDSYRICVDSEDSVDEMITAIFRLPGWIKCLMKIRNLLVSCFGLKTGNEEASNLESHYSIGSKAAFFTVVDRNEWEIVMAEEDVHLDFRSSVLVEKEGRATYLYLTTVVHFNNFWGRLYFLPVKPFHKRIVKSLLKRYAMGKLLTILEKAV